jgi:hypothetical protein
MSKNDSEQFCCPLLRSKNRQAIARRFLVFRKSKAEVV